MKRRGQMKPGEMFVCRLWLVDWVWPRTEVWVVVDSKTEVGFWSGAVTCFGDVAPGLGFEML